MTIPGITPPISTGAAGGPAARLARSSYLPGSLAGDALEELATGRPTSLVGLLSSHPRATVTGGAVRLDGTLGTAPTASGRITYPPRRRVFPAETASRARDSAQQAPTVAQTGTLGALAVATGGAS